MQCGGLLGLAKLFVTSRMLATCILFQMIVRQLVLDFLLQLAWYMPNKDVALGHDVILHSLIVSGGQLPFTYWWLRSGKSNRAHNTALHSSVLLWAIEFVTHWVIDCIKTTYRKGHTDYLKALLARRLVMHGIDQLCHVVVMVLECCYILLYHTSITTVKGC